MGVSVFKTIRSPIAKTIYVLLAVAFFVGFGILTALQPGRVLPKIKYENQDIYADEFFLILKELQDAGESDERVTVAAFDMLLARKAISEIMSGVGLDISGDYLVAVIMNSIGQGEQRVFRDLIRSAGATKRSFENYIRDSYLFSKFQDIVVRTQTVGDLDEFQSVLSWVAGMRDVLIAEVKKSGFELSVSPQEMRNYYLFNQLDFKIPESRDLWIAKFPTSETASGFFSENQTRKFDSFDEFRTAVDSVGGTVTEIRLGKDKATDILVQFFSEEVTEGTLFPPIETNNEWWIVLVRRIQRERVKTYDEALPEIKEKLLAGKLLERVESFIKEKQDRISSPEDFQRVFSPLAQSIKREKFMGYIGLYPIVGAVPELTEYILSRRENFIFPKAIQRDGKIYVLFLGEHTPSQEDFYRFLIFDTERFIQDNVVFLLGKRKIYPPSRDEAIRILMGER